MLHRGFRPPVVAGWFAHRVRPSRPERAQRLLHNGFRRRGRAPARVARRRLRVVAGAPAAAVTRLDEGRAHQSELSFEARERCGRTGRRDRKVRLQLRLVARRPTRRVPRDGPRRQQHDLRRRRRRERPAEPGLRAMARMVSGRRPHRLRRPRREALRDERRRQRAQARVRRQRRRRVRALLVAARRPDCVLRRLAPPRRLE